MHYGLKRLNSNPSIGLKAIIDVCDLKNKEITTSDIVFKIGPRINASGRMSSGKEAVELLVAKDYTSAKEKSDLIDNYNKTRKDLDKQATDEAHKEILKLKNLGDKSSIVVYNQEWNKGVIGIVASRLSEQYFKPAVVLTLSNGMATGSARSIAGFDLYKAIDSCRDLLENFGGHIYAAGLTLKLENVKEFKERFEDYVSKNITDEQKIPQIDIDTELSLNEINDNFFERLGQFAPYGPDNTKPIFVTSNVIDAGGCKLVGIDQKHLKLDVCTPDNRHIRCSGIAFNVENPQECIEHIKSKKPFNICYTLEENNFNGKKSIQLMVKDIQLT